MNLKATRALRRRHVLLYRLSEDLTGLLIAAMVVFSPWAFGTTEPWSIRTMNFAGYTLGLLLACKLWIRHLKDYRPPRWSSREPAPARPRLENQELSQTDALPRSGGSITVVLACLTALLLAWCGISALNARATCQPGQAGIEYYDCIRWLPHSYDQAGTWAAFWMYLGLACAFWAARDWLLGKSTAEESAQLRSRRGPSDLAGADVFRHPLPARARWLLWLLALNGTALALEGIAQRWANSPRLLFLVLPRIHQEALSQFGPYAYRANAAQYLNLVWPVCVGFWWTLTHASRSRRVAASSHWLPACAGVMAAGAILSASRGGALITLAMAGVAIWRLGVQAWVPRHSRHPHRAPVRWTLAAVTLCLAATLLLTYFTGRNALLPRLADSELEAGLASREQLYAVGRRIAADYPVWGTGPGTYETVSEFYRPAELAGRFFPAQLHNDWLETRVTFGWAGTALIAALLATVGLHWFLGGSLPGGRHLVSLGWLALAGCLVHARYDFPFQVHSVLFVFVLLCAVLVVFSKRS